MRTAMLAAFLLALGWAGAASACPYQSANASAGGVVASDDGAPPQSKPAQSRAPQG